MSHLTRFAVALFVVLACWAGFAQVRETPREKPRPPAGAEAGKKLEAATKKGAAEKSNAALPAQKDGAKPATPPQRAPVAESPDAATIRKSAEAFVSAYNAHDAKAVAELFAPKAEFTDEDGNLVQGREAIQQNFSEMFADNPDCRIELEIESIRLLTPNFAIEEGTVQGQVTPGSFQNLSTYVAVHIKADGKWSIASINDYEVEPELSAGDRLQELAWMVGEWIEEGPESVVKSVCRWDESGSYLLHDFSIQIEGSPQSSGSMRIGWDPLSQQFKSWTFDADSGYSEGLWTRTGDEWSVCSRGVNGSGQLTTATNVFHFIDENTLTWRSYDRTVSGEPVDDVFEYVVKRQAPEPNE